MLQSTERQEVLSYLQREVGFPFDESELSPGVRKRISDLAGLRQQISFKQWDLSQLTKKKSDYLLYLIVLIVLGIVTIVVIIGIVFLAAAYYVYTERNKIESKIGQSTLDSENMTRTMGAGLSDLAKAAHQELSLQHEVKTHPIAAGSTVQLMKETVVKEVVLLACRYCGNRSPQGTVKCRSCGANL